MADPRVTHLTFICRQCGAQSSKSGQRQWYCAACAIDRERARSQRAGVSRTKGVHGTPFACCRCGSVTPRQSVKQLVCSPCQPLAKREQNTAAARERRKTPEARAKEKLRATLRNRTPERREYIKAYEKKRRTRDPKFAIHARMKAMVANVLRGTKNGRSWQDLVGYTCEDLMAHIGRQFCSGMSWDNRHLWHVDHIVPVAAFQFTSPSDDEFRACWALTNLRPLWSSENRRKSDQRLFLL